MMILLQAPISNPLLKWTIGKSSDQGAPILGKFISNFIGLLLVLAAIWAFFNLLLGGISWISSGGDKGKLEAAQQKILQAIIGLGIVFLSWAVFLVLLRFLGMSGPGGLKLALPKLFL